MHPFLQHVPWGKLALGGSVLALSFLGALGVMSLFGSSSSGRRPALAAVPPLPPLTRTSTIVTPVAITHAAIRDAMERAAPRDLSGKRDNPLTQLLSNAEIGWTMTRGPLAVAGRSEALTIATTLTGTFRATGQLAKEAGNITGALGGLLGGNLKQNMQGLTERTIDQRADMRGNVTVTARPALQPAWRIEPNLAAQVAMADVSISLLGARLNIANEVKPLLDRNVTEQITALQSKIRNDPILETVARREWAKMCRSIPVGGKGVPSLWLEMRPTRAFAGQPRVTDQALVLTVGVEAETRIVPSESKPSCPFPATLELVPQIDQGRIAVAVPIDVPFTEVNHLLEAQLEGKTFPEDPASAFRATVRSVQLAASGDRLLISLGVRAAESKSSFGLGADAGVHVWGKPVLDPARQVLRLEDVTLDVESQAAFGLLGAAARAAVPYLESALAEQAVIDLTPFMANARTSIETALADFRKVADGVRVDTAVTGVRLVGIAFDAKTLRVVAEADGTVRAEVSKLP